MILFAVRTNNTGFDTKSPEYALYKNTMFKDCYNTPLSNITYDCSAIRSSLYKRNGTAVGLDRPTLSLPSNASEINTVYSWCEVMSCFSDFKVIPSTPRPSAFWPTLLEVWNKAAITFFFSFWELKNLQTALYSDISCKGLKWDNWLIMAWDLGSFIWWCVGLGRFATFPKTYPVPSMVGWVSVWKYCYTIHYHPYECVLQRSPRKAHIIKWTLCTLATLQWIASVYICFYSFRSVIYENSPYPAYTCLASRISDAPGATSCSAEQLCANEPLFHSFSFNYPNQYLNGVVALTGFLLAFSFIAIVMICARVVYPWTAFQIRGGSIEKWRERAFKFDFGYAGSMGAAGFGCLLYAAMTGVDVARALDRSREGSVAFNWECNALHVNVSPWRYYLDVNYELPVRVAKMWFNS